MMVTKARNAVRNPELWWKDRRPELVEYFDAEVYGRVPEGIPAVKWEAVTEEEFQAAGAPVRFGGPPGGGRGGPPPASPTPSVTKYLLGRVDNSAYPTISVTIRLTLTLPENATDPVPVIVDLGGAGGRNEYLARGLGYARLDPNSIQADNGAGLTRGIIGLVNKSKLRKPDDWGALWSGPGARAVR